MVIATALVAVAATGVVLIRDPLKGSVASGGLALTLALLFVLLRAPEVAISEVVVGGIAVPAMVVLALARIRGAR